MTWIPLIPVPQRKEERVQDSPMRDTYHRWNQKHGFMISVSSSAKSLEEVS